MFWDDKGDSEDTQKFKNLVLMKMWATNKDRDDMMPILAVMVIVAVIVLVVVALI